MTRTEIGESEQQTLEARNDRRFHEFRSPFPRCRALRYVWKNFLQKQYNQAQAP
jgi:hypothetical protein